MKRFIFSLAICLSIFCTVTAQAAVYQAFAEETIAVSTTAIGFTTAKVVDNNSYYAQTASCCLESGNIRYAIISSPTSSVGTPVLMNSCFTITGQSDIKRIRFIESNTSSAAGSLTCTYSR